MTALTPRQHTVLARLSEGDWIIGADLSAPGVLGVLRKRGLIREGIDGDAIPDMLWTITPDGLAALERAGQ